MKTFFGALFGSIIGILIVGGLVIRNENAERRCQCRSQEKAKPETANPENAEEIP
jgi:hypothetical protein